ncbi:CLUMA_CG019726, isoform A [Clunio marinus]|uniref:CLUMA_CG019726, isoform A n=1 Tax=Clunio marinus TaxID=568069 RepID=A0A1J1J279_9DIPT|nr:CLUMA_CG019726, isoform A [Clunio marinus]
MKSSSSGIKKHIKAEHFHARKQIVSNTKLFPFDDQAKMDKEMKWWCGNYVMNKEMFKCRKEKHKSPLHVASLAIAYDFD